VRLLVLGAGYIGAALAERALARGHEVVLADNWYATESGQLAGLARAGARVETADIRDRGDLERLLAERPDRLYLLAAQASRPVSERDPDYTEETNVSGTRRVAEAVAESSCLQVVFGSSLQVYGGAPRGAVDVDHPYGEQRDLSHLSKVYGELCLTMYARRRGFDLTLARLAIVYGESPVEHAQAESQTVVDKFRRLAAEGQPLPVDDPRVTIGVVHLDDAARILLALPEQDGVAAVNVCAETVTVGDVAALAGGSSPPGGAGCDYVSGFDYKHRLAEYLRS
jgi:UDP-glucose 4-epimerase